MKRWRLSETSRGSSSPTSLFSIDRCLFGRTGNVTSCPLAPAVFESSELPPQAFPLGAPPLAFSAAASAAHAAVNAAATSVASTTASAGADAVKLLFGLVLLLVAGFAYWVSPAYERLYQKLFGRLDHY